jgi:ADP-heptose:LPS heptosyltransferase
MVERKGSVRRFRMRAIYLALACTAAWTALLWLRAAQAEWVTLLILLSIAALIAIPRARSREYDDAELNARRCAAIAVVNLVGCAIAALPDSSDPWLHSMVLAASFAVALRLSVELARDRAGGPSVVALISSASAWTVRGLVISVADRIRHSGIAKALLARGRPRAPYANDQVERVMVVSHSYIGDAVMQTPAIELLAKALPRARIAVLTNAATDGVFRDNPFVHERVRCLPTHGMYPTLAELRQILRLRRNGPTLCVLDFNGSQTLGIWFAWLAGAGYVIADGSLAADARFLADEIVSTDDLSHHVERNAAVVSRSSIGSRDLQGVPELAPILSRDAPELAAAIASLREMRVTDSTALIGLVVGSAGGFAMSKRWPLERFAALVSQLRARLPNVAVLAFKGPQELDVAYDALEQAGCHIVEGKTLREVAALVAQCDAVVGNDSGLAHLSASMGTPVVTIFGPTNHDLVKPYARTSISLRQEGCPPCFGGEELVRCRGERPCILGVTVERVADATLSVLGRRGARSQRPDWAAKA